jgi:DNA-binding winged helix-turn-helix (wHTH) protein/tetratricopeptide (TPR) repeat protein
MKEFHQFRLDTINQCLWRRKDTGAEERLLLKPKPYAILRYLVDHPGRLVTQDELLDGVWPDTHVQPDVLKRHILDIRAVLGDYPKSPVFIETLPRRGYQFIAPIRDDVSEAAEPTRQGQGVIVGRGRALGDLREHVRRAIGGQRQIVFVTGEPGIGKTTLVDELQRQPGTNGIVRTARGQCVEGFGGTEAYYPVLDALGKLCRSPGGDSVVQILASHAPTWLVQFPALVTREQRQSLSRELLGATRERMLREIGEALETLAATATLLLVLEDLQWVDPSTVDLISAIARGRTPARLMLIGTYRTLNLSRSELPIKQVKQDLRVHQLCHEIALGPLGETDVVEYMGSTSPGADLPAGLPGLVHRHSEGNPLFMVAALDHMTQRGFVLRENGSWKLNVPLEEIDLEVPENLRAMIETQIDQLNSAEQRALEVASVSGIAFTGRVSAGAADQEEENFEDLCEQLSRRQQMLRWVGAYQFPDGTVSQRYEFVHALYREVFYRRQAPGRRLKLHLRIGERLEALFPNHEGDVAAELAEHFEQASDWPRAVKYLRLAANSATRRYAYGEAVEVLRNAAELVTRLPEAGRVISELEILEQLAALYIARADISAAKETLEKLIGLAAQSGLIDVEIRALIAMALPAAWTSARLYIETVERALSLSARLRDPLLQARTQARCFAWRSVAGRWSQEDAESCERAIAEIEHKGDRLAIAEHRLESTYLLSLSSRYADAHRVGADSLAIVLEQGDLNQYVSMLCQVHRYLVSRNLMFCGEWGQALKEIETMIALLERNGDHTRGQEMPLHEAWIRLHAMDFFGVLAICQSIRPAVRIPSGIRLWHILTGSAEAALGNYDRSLDHLRKVKDEMERLPIMDDWYQSLPLQAGFVELWLGKGDLTQAHDAAERFLNTALTTAERTYQGLAWEAAARVAIAAQESARAGECIARALSTIESYEVPLAAWRVHGTASAIYERVGIHDLAAQHRRQSRAIIMKLANSLGPEDPLRTTFLAAPSVSRIVDHAERVGV